MKAILRPTRSRVSLAFKVDQNNLSYFSGGAVGMIIIVNLVGCLKTKKTEEKVKQDEIDEYWEDLTKRDAEAEKDASLTSQ